ncbi:MAG TPA: asparagine synthase (glutamine-hydrolyzing) [Bryobacteraceae bacterium]|jgi:asparagine synthase (glutamine-hydrolysing)|nr:asparagine synthase (glutamine-hydrolyzing) [Bryobacteraceae bacterium]
MCGIAGLARSGSDSAAELATSDAAIVGRVLAAEVHRGPDGEGLYQQQFPGGSVVLGHRRLAIIDLSSAGLQPMSNDDGSLHVTFNGEIYNFQELRAELGRRGHGFRTQTDTEVLLHGYEEWGIEGLLDRLRGMFAFALLDSRRGLILARDRMGIKPLYYHAGADFLLFASEVKALMRSGVVPDESDRHALTGFLMAGAVPQPLTIVKAVRCLPPGHWAEWRGGVFTVRKYWDLQWPPSPEAGVKAENDDLSALLDETVRQHLISDVPLGVFLSGGVDSAGLVALASRIRREQGNPLVTLTVVFDERQFSEASPAAEVAKRFGTSHREIRVTEGDFKRELPAFLASMDQPTNDGVNSYFVSKAAREAGLKVVLSGLGGDEVFWGYKHYRRLRPGGPASRIPAPLWSLLGSAGYGWGCLRGRDNWKRAAWLRSGGSSESVYLTMRGFFAPAQVARLMDLTQAELNEAVEEHFGALLTEHKPDAASINYLEVKRYMHDQLLRDTDIFSMAHSIEARVPYLDHVLVERLWNTSAASKLDARINKPLLVDAVDDAAVLAAGSRPKRGFTFPMARWMKTCAPELREIAESGANQRSMGRKAVRECWTGFSEGKVHWSRAWALTVLGSAN